MTGGGQSATIPAIGDIMTEHTKKGLAQDRAKVAGGQPHETAYEANKTGASAGAVREAVKSVGNSRSKVESELKGGKKK
jgi:hypothetical protein